MTELKKSERTRTRKVLASLAAVTMVGVAGVAGTTAALSDTTDNVDNSFDAAYIDLSDNDGDTAASWMYQVTDQEFGVDVVERCIEISYTGSRPADVGVYMPTPLSVGAQHVNLVVEVGTTPAPPVFSNTDDTGCTGFAPGTAGTAGELYDGPLSTFQTAHATPATAFLAGPDGATTAALDYDWTDTDTAVYKVTLTVNKANNLIPSTEIASGLHTFTWEAVTA